MASQDLTCMHCMTIPQRRGSLTLSLSLSLSLYKAKLSHAIGLVQFVRLRPKSFYFFSDLASSLPSFITLLLLFQTHFYANSGVSILQVSDSNSTVFYLFFLFHSTFFLCFFNFGIERNCPAISPWNLMNWVRILIVLFKT